MRDPDGHPQGGDVHPSSLPAPWHPGASEILGLDYQLGQVGGTVPCTGPLLIPGGAPRAASKAEKLAPYAVGRESSSAFVDH